MCNSAHNKPKMSFICMRSSSLAEDATLTSTASFQHLLWPTLAHQKTWGIAYYSRSSASWAATVASQSKIPKWNKKIRYMHTQIHLLCVHVWVKLLLHIHLNLRAVLSIIESVRNLEKPSISLQVAGGHSIQSLVWRTRATRMQW